MRECFARYVSGVLFAVRRKSLARLVLGFFPGGVVHEVERVRLWEVKIKTDV